MLYQFYNYYSDTLAATTASKYDAHPRSELRDLYHTIIKLNKESPLYLIHMSDELQENIIDVKESARALKNTILPILEDEDKKTLKMFHDKVLTSSHPDLISSEYIGNYQHIDLAPCLEVEVSHLATNQVNKGNFLPTDNNNLPSGSYSFYVTISSLNYEFQFLVKENEMNKNILKKVSNMINRADIGIISSIESDETGNLQRINLASTATGTDNLNDLIFEIYDHYTGALEGCVQYLGLDQVIQKPMDSKFSINGIARTSASNTFTVNKQYELTLHQGTLAGEVVTISFQNDRQSAYNKIISLVDAYNDMIDFANDTSSPIRKGFKLLADIGSIGQCYKDELDSMGLFVQPDSSIEVDSFLLTDTVAQEEAGDGTYAAFRSFRNPLDEKLDYILLNPIEYVSKTIVTYPSMEQEYTNVYAISMYSGLLFNNYC